MRVHDIAFWLALVAPCVRAQSGQGLSGRIAFGYLATSGNAETESLNLKLDGEYAGESWQHALRSQAVTASSDEVHTAEAYALSWKSRFELSERAYAFGLMSWNKDRFSGYEKQVRESGGYGRRFLDSERNVLNAEIGAGVRQADLRDGTIENETILRLASDYRWTISETADFTQTLAVERGSENTYSEWVSSLTTDVWKDIAVVLSFTIKYNSDVPDGAEKRDTFTAISLEYSF